MEIIGRKFSPVNTTMIKLKKNGRHINSNRIKFLLELEHQFLIPKVIRKFIIDTNVNLQLHEKLSIIFIQRINA